MRKAASVLSRIMAEQELGDCEFVATYGLFGSKKSNEFKNGKGKEFVLAVTPKESGVGTGSYYGGMNGGYGSEFNVQYSMNGVSKAAKACKDNIKQINEELNAAIGPCRAKVGDIYKDRGYITVIVTMK